MLPEHSMVHSKTWVPRNVILNPTVHPITAPSSATDDFKEPPVFVKELVDMEANDGDRVELVVKVEGQYP